MGATPTESKSNKTGFNGPGHLKTKFDLVATYARGSGKYYQEIKISTSSVAPNPVTLTQAKKMAKDWLKLTLPDEIGVKHAKPYIFKGFSGTCQALNFYKEPIETVSVGTYE